MHERAAATRAERSHHPFFAFNFLSQASIVFLSLAPFHRPGALGVLACCFRLYGIRLASVSAYITVTYLRST